MTGTLQPVPGPEFNLAISHNPYMAWGARGELHAIVSVESAGGSRPPTAAAEVIVLDTSASMEWPVSKIVAARQAAMTAIDTLRDGVEFAVVAGSHVAAMVYPSEAKTVPASARTKIEAKAAIGGLAPSGGTAMGAWLQLADRLLAPHTEAIRHAILLTDGKNEHEAPEQFEATVQAVSGKFVCDCRGVGTDWVPGELRRIASGLLGSVDIVADSADLAADFRAMTANAMGKAVGDVALRIWTSQGAGLRFVKQVLPAVEDLTHLAQPAGSQAYEYPIGAWGTESRDYHICVDVPPGDIGQEMRAAWVRVVKPGDPPTVLAAGNVIAEWTDDEAAYTKINDQVAHYTGQAELAEAIQGGLHAKQVGDLDTATTRLGRAVALAHQTGNVGTAALLDRVVDVIDEPSGTVRLKKAVDKVDEISLDTRSTRTVRTRKE